MNYFETMHTCCEYIEDMHVNFCRSKIFFENQDSAESGVAPVPGWGLGGGGGGHRCNINFSNGQSIGIVLYGMCSHSLYIKGEN